MPAALGCSRLGPGRRCLISVRSFTLVVGRYHYRAVNNLPPLLHLLQSALSAVLIAGSVAPAFAAAAPTAQQGEAAQQRCSRAGMSSDGLQGIILNMLPAPWVPQARCWRSCWRRSPPRCAGGSRACTALALATAAGLSGWSFIPASTQCMSMLASSLSRPSA